MRVCCAHAIPKAYAHPAHATEPLGSPALDPNLSGIPVLILFCGRPPKARVPLTSRHRGTYHGAKVGKKDSLESIEIEVAAEYAKKQEKKRKRYPAGGRTRIGADVRARKRWAPPVPKNRSMSEIAAMDPDDPAFHHGNGRKRKWEPVDDADLDVFDLVKKKKQRRAQLRRASARHYEAKVIAATREMEKHVSEDELAMEIYDEDRAVAEGILNLDDWDDEELVRGYRRNRSGRFGTAPKYVPREIQQEIFRRLVSRGERRLRSAYLATIDNLIDLAHNADSEKVRLEAQKELMNRVIGKVPDRMLVSQDEPWMDVLADSFVPVSEVPPIEMEVNDAGVAQMPLEPGDEVEAPVGVTEEPSLQRPNPADTEAAPSSSGRSKRSPGVRVPKTGAKSKSPRKGASRA